MACETAFQIRRQFGPLSRHSSIFDHQITPGEAVLEYFERDFRGLFERADLEAQGDGTIINRRFGTKHPHEFPRGLEKSYAEARSRHDYLCSKLRNVLDGNVDTLFVFSGHIGVPGDLRSLIHRRNPWLEFDIVNVRTTGAPTRPALPWQGNDAEWKAALSHFKVQPPDYFKRQAHRLWRHLRGNAS